MEHRKSDNPFRSISPLNLDTQIKYELPTMENISISPSERSFRTAETYNNSPSLSSSNTNIDDSLMMSTIDNLRRENVSLTVENIILEEEITLLKNKIKDLKKKCNSLSNDIVIEEVIEKHLFPQNAGLYILIGGSITTCIVYVFDIWKNY